MNKGIKATVRDYPGITFQFLLSARLANCHSSESWKPDFFGISWTPGSKMAPGCAATHPMELLKLGYYWKAS